MSRDDKDALFAFIGSGVIGFLLGGMIGVFGGGCLAEHACKPNKAGIANIDGKLYRCIEVVPTYELKETTKND